MANNTKTKLTGKLKLYNDDYTSSPEDVLTIKKIDQLHNATSMFSKQSFEIKKVFLTIEVAALTLISNFVETELYLALFVTALIIALIFYLLDSVTYYYQNKLRGIMVDEENQFRTRNLIQPILNPHSHKALCSSFINWSHWIYLAVALLDVILFFIFKEKLA